MAIVGLNMSVEIHMQRKYDDWSIDSKQQKIVNHKTGDLIGVCTAGHECQCHTIRTQGCNNQLCSGVGH